MSSIPVRPVGEIAASVVEHVEDAVGALPTLAAVLAWGRAQEPPRPVVEIVTQDEYTHDVVVPLGGVHYLSFDTT